jgi:hypothetical protein
LEVTTEAEAQEAEAKVAAAVELGGDAAEVVAMIGVCCLVVWPAPPPDVQGEASSGGRPPFGLRVVDGRVGEDPEAAPVCRWLYAQEDAPGATLDAMAREVVQRWPWLRERWTVPRKRRQKIAEILARRSEVEAVLGGAS